MPDTPLFRSDTFYAGVLNAAGVEPNQNLYYDTSTAIIALVLLGRFLEARARAHTGDAIRSLVALGAKTARVRRPVDATEDLLLYRKAARR